jgi:hypothetical protein
LSRGERDYEVDGRDLPSDDGWRNSYTRLSLAIWASDKRAGNKKILNPESRKLANLESSEMF